MLGYCFIKSTTGRADVLNISVDWTVRLDDHHISRPTSLLRTLLPLLLLSHSHPQKPPPRPFPSDYYRTLHGATSRIALGAARSGRLPQELLQVESLRLRCPGEKQGGGIRR